MTDQEAPAPEPIVITIHPTPESIREISEGVARFAAMIGPPEDAPLDCRSDAGITVGLIDGIIAAARVLRTRDVSSHPAVVHALRDLAADEDLAWLTSSLFGRAVIEQAERKRNERRDDCPPCACPPDRCLTVPEQEEEDGLPQWERDLLERHAAATERAAERQAVAERIADIIRDANGTAEALAAWERHPQIVPAHVYAAALAPLFVDERKRAEEAERLAANSLQLVKDRGGLLNSARDVAGAPDWPSIPRAIRSVLESAHALSEQVAAERRRADTAEAVERRVRAEIARQRRKVRETREIPDAIAADVHTRAIDAFARAVDPVWQA